MKTPYELLKDFIGIGEGGENLSTQYKDKFAEGIEQKYHSKTPLAREGEAPQKSGERCSTPASIASEGKTLGDIVNPIVPEEDRECLE